MVIYGNDGINYLNGTSAADIIYGFGNFDSLVGWGGADLLYGGVDGDMLYGGAGDDRLYGEDGDDWLDGGTGTDLIDGGAGNDTALYGANTGALSVDLALGQCTFPGQPWPMETLLSIESVETGSGNDSVAGTSGINLIKTGEGDDTVFARGGNDVVAGEDGADLLRGGGGNDRILGGLGADRLYGEGGNDTLSGDGGQDRLDGGSGTDTVIYGDGARWDDPTADGHNITVDLARGKASFTGYDGKPWAYTETLVSIENATTGRSNDTLIGNGGANILDGGNGQNRILGGGGDDVIYGSISSGHSRAWTGGTPAGGYFGDYIDGGAGNDVIFTRGAWEDYPDDDTYRATPGYELVFGGSGNDVIHMGYGDLHVTGGSGRDEFRFSDGMVSAGDDNYESYYAEKGAIEDYSRAQSDRIVIDVGRPADFRFVASNPDEAGEWSYARDGDDVVATIRLDQERTPGVSGLVAIEIRLADYTGPISQSDFHFV